MREFDPHAIKRPDEALLTYYVIISAFALIAFPIVFLSHWVKYKTLKYGFADEGVSMSWGLLFRKEIYLTYRRIQDIHVTRNLIQRWLGLADVAVQTASGGAGVEMTIEGILEPDRLRDFLYSNMRGAHAETDEHAAHRAVAGASGGADEIAPLLREIRDSLRALGGSADERP